MKSFFTFLTETESKAKEQSETALQLKAKRLRLLRRRTEQNIKSSSKEYQTKNIVCTIFLCVVSTQ